MDDDRQNETDRCQDIERVTPDGFTGFQNVTSQERVGMQSQDDQSFSIPKHDSIHLQEGFFFQGRANQLYESRDYGVKVMIDTLSNKDKLLDQVQRDSIVKNQQLINKTIRSQDDMVDDEQDYRRSRAGLSEGHSSNALDHEIELDNEILDEIGPVGASIKEAINPFASDFNNHAMRRDLTDKLPNENLDEALFSSSPPYPDGEKQLYQTQHTNLVDNERDELIHKIRSDEPDYFQFEKNFKSPDFLERDIEFRNNISPFKDENYRYSQGRFIEGEEMFALNDTELDNRMFFDINVKPNLDDQRARKMIINELQSKRIQEEFKKDSSFFLVIDKSPIEQVDDIVGPYWKIKRLVLRTRININSAARLVVSSRAFEGCAIAVIVMNSILLAVQDPTAVTQPSYIDALDNMFLALYTVEMIFKILALGFFFNKGAYLRNGWNILDFVVIMTGYLQLMLQDSNVNISGLRVFRVLRPLRSIQKIQGLKLLVQSLLTSLPLLRDTLIVLLFFFYVFAIAGLQLFSGGMKKRCMNIETGDRDPSDAFCGTVECKSYQFCGKTLENYNYSQTSFDNIFQAYLSVFVSVTLEWWTYIMSANAQTVTSFAFLYSIPLAFIGAQFLLNLLLAVISAKFAEAHEKKSEEPDANLKARALNMNEVEFDILDANEKQKMIEDQVQVRNVIIKKWKTIQFIKDRMREYIRMYRIRKWRKQMIKEKQKSDIQLSTVRQSAQASSRPKARHGDRKSNAQRNQTPDINSNRGGIVVVEQRRSKSPIVELDIETEGTPIRTSEDSPGINYTPTRFKSQTKVMTDKKQEDLTKRKVGYQNYFALDNFDQSANANKSARHTRSINSSIGFTPKKSTKGVHRSHILDISPFQQQQDEQLEQFINQDVQSIAHQYSEHDLQQIAENLKEAFQNVDGNISPQIAALEVQADTMRYIEEEAKNEQDTLISRRERQLESYHLAFTPEITNPQREQPSPIRPFSFRIRPIPLQLITSSQNSAAVLSKSTTKRNTNHFDTPQQHAGDVSSTNAKDHTNFVKSEVKNKIVPFNDHLESLQEQEEELRQNEQEMEEQRQDIISIEKSVLNKRFLVEMEIQKHQKIYIRKDKFNFQSTVDIFEDRKKKVQLKPKSYKSLILSVGMKSNLHSAFVKPYQRRFCIKPKLYAPDDDEIKCLEELNYDAADLEFVIQQKYDRAYLSKQVVTSTLSICIQAKEKESTQITKTRCILDKELKVSRKVKRYRPKLEHSAKSTDEATQARLFTLENQLSSTLRRPSFKGFNSQQAPEGGRNFFQSLQKWAIEKVADQNPKLIKQQMEVQLFIRNQLEPQISKSLKEKSHIQVPLKDLVEKLKKINGELNGKDEEQEEAKKEMLRKQIQLQKRANRDQQLQKRLIIAQLNKGAFMSRLFRQRLAKRKNQITEEDLQKPHLKEMYEKIEDAELAKLQAQDGDDEEEEEDSSDEEGQINDEFLDLPIDSQKHINKSRQQQAYTKKNTSDWSGQDVVLDCDPEYAHEACQSLSSLRVWPKGLKGIIKRIQVFNKALVKTKRFESFVTICVFLNTVSLSMERVGMSQAESDQLNFYNYIFTWVFISEMALKITGLGPAKYLKDRINYLDGLIVILSIMELIVMQGSYTGAHQAFRSVRIFRIFRVLRVARLLRSLQSMHVIMAVLQKSFSSIMYLGLLFCLFIFIYCLLGMQLFGGKLNFESNFSVPLSGVPRNNYDTFHFAFLTIFQITTIESWPQILYDGLRSGENRFIVVIFYISWIFLGSYILMNLFLAILLDSFEDETLQNKNKQHDKEELRLQQLEALKTKEGTDLIEYFLVDRADVVHQAQEAKKKQLSAKKKGGAQVQEQKKEQNILDESFEYDKKSLTQKIDLIQKQKVVFEDVYCEYSFYILSKSNWFRIIMYKICTNMKFEGVIMTLIVLSSLKLVIDTYIFDLPSTDAIFVLSNNLDLFFTAAFAFESFVKSISFGFCFEKGSYLRDSWSQLDFFIVFFSVLDASLSSVNIPMIKILRILRILRPLRFISHNSGMKTIVQALIQSFGGIVNVGIVVVVIWIMFAILAVNLFGGKLWQCSINYFSIVTEKECIQSNGYWMLWYYHYEDVPDAMISLFALSTEENWPDYMYAAMNIAGDNIGPVLYNSQYYSFYFVAFMMIGSNLFMNIFVGVIFKEFEDAQEAERASLMLKESQRKWVDMMKMIVQADPDIETTNIPKEPWRQKVHAFVTGSMWAYNYFDMFIMAVIVLNMVQMSLQYDESPLIYNQLLDDVNYFFTAVFVIEFILKQIAFGKSYYKQGWNLFDLFIVTTSCLEILLQFIKTKSMSFMRIGPQLARILRVLRVSRLLRLLNKYKGLQALIQTLWFSMPALMNVFALLMLVYFIYAVLGTYLFRQVTTGQIISEFFNFSNFGNALIICIRMSTGEDWNYIFQDCWYPGVCQYGEGCSIWYAPAFHITFQFATVYIFLNLFVLVIIQQFEMYYLDADNVLMKFKEDLERFKITWTHFTKDNNCLKIKDTRLVAFMGHMDAPLGMRGAKINEIIRNVMKMELESDNEGYVYFNELLYKVMRRIYGDSHVKNKVLIKCELVTMRKIEAIKEQMIKKSRVQERLRIIQVNPFSLQLFRNSSFKAWLKLYRKYRLKIQIQKDLNEKGFVADSQLQKQSLEFTNKDTLLNTFKPSEMTEKEEEEEVVEQYEYQTMEDIEVDENDEGESSVFIEDAINQDEDRERMQNVLYLPAEEEKEGSENHHDSSNKSSMKEVNTNRVYPMPIVKHVPFDDDQGSYMQGIKRPKLTESSPFRDFLGAGYSSNMISDIEFPTVSRPSTQQKAVVLQPIRLISGKTIEYENDEDTQRNQLDQLQME